MKINNIKSLAKAVIFTALFGMSVSATAEDKFYLPDFTITAGETKEVAIQFESDKVSASDPAQLEYVAFQFDLYLPEGLTVAQKKGKFSFAFNEARMDDHTFTSAVQADGSIRVLSASLTNASFWETKGDFVKFTLEAAANFTGGKIALKKIMFSTKGGVRSELKDVETLISETTSIDGITAGNLIKGDVYTVAGQLVQKNATTLDGLSKGVYVVNGQKVVIK